MINNLFPRAAVRARSLMDRSDEGDRGATMIEYGLLVFVIVTIVFVGFTAFGNSISTWLSDKVASSVTSH